MKANGQHDNHTDYDLHGIVGIRLFGARPGDRRAVSRQLGPIQAPLKRDPDIIIRFVERLPLSGTVRYLGLNEAGFTDDAFLVLECKHRPVRVQIPFDQIGGRCEIVCETGLPAVPLLIPIVNLTALSKGVLPLHAAAFEQDGVGVLVTGWSKGGKTETLLGFLARGARYIGDEWVYLEKDGQLMHGIPEPMRVWDWHLSDLPQFRKLLTVGERFRMKALKAALAGCRFLSGSDTSQSKWRKLARRAASLLQRQIYADVAPQRLVGQQSGPMSGPLDHVLFVVSHDAAETVAEPIDVNDVARRMVYSLQYERLSFMAYYRMAQFAFPDLHNSLIERAETHRRTLLTQALAGKPAHAVFHPYPAPIPALVETIAPLLVSSSPPNRGESERTAELPRTEVMAGE